MMYCACGATFGTAQEYAEHRPTQASVPAEGSKSTFYEVLPHLRDEAGEVTLAASFTANNGIRIGLLESEGDDPDWREFDFDVEQAEIVGEALVRWAQRSRAEREVIRCAVGWSGRAERAV